MDDWHHAFSSAFQLSVLCPFSFPLFIELAPVGGGRIPISVQCAKCCLGSWRAAPLRLLRPSRAAAATNTAHCFSRSSPSRASLSCIHSSKCRRALPLPPTSNAGASGSSYLVFRGHRAHLFSSSVYSSSGAVVETPLRGSHSHFSKHWRLTRSQLLTVSLGLSFRVDNRKEDASVSLCRSSLPLTRSFSSRALRRLCFKAMNPPRRERMDFPRLACIQGDHGFLHSSLGVFAGCREGIGPGHTISLLFGKSETKMSRLLNASSSCRPAQSSCLCLTPTPAIFAFDRSLTRRLPLSFFRSFYSASTFPVVSVATRPPLARSPLRPVGIFYRSPTLAPVLSSLLPSHCRSPVVGSSPSWEPLNVSRAVRFNTKCPSFPPLHCVRRRGVQTLPCRRRDGTKIPSTDTTVNRPVIRSCSPLQRVRKSDNQPTPASHFLAEIPGSLQCPSSLQAFPRSQDNGRIELRKRTQEKPPYCQTRALPPKSSRSDDHHRTPHYPFPFREGDRGLRRVSLSSCSSSRMTEEASATPRPSKATPRELRAHDFPPSGRPLAHYSSSAGASSFFSSSSLFSTSSIPSPLSCSSALAASLSHCSPSQPSLSTSQASFWRQPFEEEALLEPPPSLLAAVGTKDRSRMPTLSSVGKAVAPSQAPPRSSSDSRDSFPSSSPFRDGDTYLVSVASDSAGEEGRRVFLPQQLLERFALQRERRRAGEQEGKRQEREEERGMNALIGPPACPSSIGSRTRLSSSQSFFTSNSRSSSSSSFASFYPVALSNPLPAQSSPCSNSVASLSSPRGETGYSPKSPTFICHHEPLAFPPPSFSRTMLLSRQEESRPTQQSFRGVVTREKKQRSHMRRTAPKDNFSWRQEAMTDRSAGPRRIIGSLRHSVNEREAKGGIRLSQVGQHEKGHEGEVKKRREEQEGPKGMAQHEAERLLWLGAAAEEKGVRQSFWIRDREILERRLRAPLMDQEEATNRMANGRDGNRRHGVKGGARTATRVMVPKASVCVGQLSKLADKLVLQMEKNSSEILTTALLPDSSFKSSSSPPPSLSVPSLSPSFSSGSGGLRQTCLVSSSPSSCSPPPSDPPRSQNDSPAARDVLEARHAQAQLMDLLDRQPDSIQRDTFWTLIDALRSLRGLRAEGLVQDQLCVLLFTRVAPRVFLSPLVEHDASRLCFAALSLGIFQSHVDIGRKVLGDVVNSLDREEHDSVATKPPGRFPALLILLIDVLDRNTSDEFAALTGRLYLHLARRLRLSLPSTTSVTARATTISPQRNNGVLARWDARGTEGNFSSAKEEVDGEASSRSKDVQDKEKFTLFFSSEHQLVDGSLLWNSGIADVLGRRRCGEPKVWQALFEILRRQQIDGSNCPASIATSHGWQGRWENTYLSGDRSPALSHSYSPPRNGHTVQMLAQMSVLSQASRFVDLTGEELLNQLFNRLVSKAAAHSGKQISSTGDFSTSSDSLSSTCLRLVDNSSSSQETGQSPTLVQGENKQPQESAPPVQQISKALRTFLESLLDSPLGVQTAARCLWMLCLFGYERKPGFSTLANSLFPQLVHRLRSPGKDIERQSKIIAYDEARADLFQVASLFHLLISRIRSVSSSDAITSSPACPTAFSSSHPHRYQAAKTALFTFLWRLGPMKKEPPSNCCSEGRLCSEGHTHSNLPDKQLMHENGEEEHQEKVDATNQMDLRHSEFHLSSETQQAMKSVLNAYPEFAEAVTKCHKGSEDRDAGWIAEVQTELARVGVKSSQVVSLPYLGATFLQLQRWSDGREREMPHATVSESENRRKVALVFDSQNSLPLSLELLPLPPSPPGVFSKNDSPPFSSFSSPSSLSSTDCASNVTSFSWRLRGRTAFLQKLLELQGWTVVGLAQSEWKTEGYKGERRDREGTGAQGEVREGPEEVHEKSKDRKSIVISRILAQLP
ncbi:hypothetical protein CSUI_003691 [Cystoisospora suis]|uniref:Rap domain-containing protein n=1 Tax=Cystoisospora suis TaxID=483139 RepID=A0A2C6L4K4_9APIC|nr:hypothetical protein CSUI_003691 [Cystoisospora suis]